MPSGFLGWACVGFLGWEGPATALLSGIESALRMSAAEAAMIVLEERCGHVNRDGDHNLTPTGGAPVPHSGLSLLRFTPQPES